MRDGILESRRPASRAGPSSTFPATTRSTGRAPKNLGNLFARIEYAKMMAGFVAAMTTKTGKIGYLGRWSTPRPGAWPKPPFSVRATPGKSARRKARDLTFKVAWIGSGSTSRGVTADPNQVAGSLFDQGCDVVVSGLDAPEP